MREGFADLAEVRLHYVEEGQGPLVVLLHGFPEFWYSWRAQISGLAAAGFRVVAPDMRGYNLSSRPAGLAAYGIGRLAADVRDLIAERGERSACVAGHDWGAAVAWQVAMRHPEWVARLAILNLPHPRRLLKALTADRQQIARSWYMLFFQLPWLPERALRAGRWAVLRRLLEEDARPGAFTPADIERYVEAWSRPGAMTAMLAYYRAAFRQRPWETATRLSPVTAPTWIIFGERDRHLRHELAEPDGRDVPHLQQVIRLPEASHWIQSDAPERVTELLADCFSRPL